MKIIKGSITDVKGITAVGKAVGIKKNKLDLALIVSDKICDTAAVYTKNNVKGSPLSVTKEHLKSGKAQAIIINSGIANVCTGEKGIKDAKLIANPGCYATGMILSGYPIQNEAHHMIFDCKSRWSGAGKNQSMQKIIQR